MLKCVYSLKVPRITGAVTGELLIERVSSHDIQDIIAVDCDNIIVQRETRCDPSTGGRTGAIGQ